MLSGFIISPNGWEIPFLSSQFFVQTVLSALKRAILKYTNTMYRWKGDICHINTSELKMSTKEVNKKKYVRMRKFWMHELVEFSTGCV